jgi:hypothetical protein
MKSLIYITLMSFKNYVIETLHKPVWLIFTLFVILIVAAAVAVQFVEPPNMTDLADRSILNAIVLAVITFFSAAIILGSFKHGSAIFTMGDVNFAFVSPIEPKTILVYGMIRLAKNSLFASVFVLFQGAIISDAFGYGFDAVLIIMLAMTLAMTASQTLSLLIYSFTNMSQKRKTAVKLVLAALFLPLLISLSIAFLQTGGNIDINAHLIQNPAMMWIPVIGWCTAGVTWLLAGNLLGWLFLGLNLLLCVGMIVFITKTNPDYYEDTLVATETLFEQRRAIAEGQINAADSVITRKIKVDEGGLGKGQGASVFFFKHIRESFRANRLGLWGVSSIVIVLVAIAFAAFMYFQAKDSDSLDFSLGFVLLLGFMMYMLVIFIGQGRGLKEMFMHFLYMTPESSFKKIIWSNLEVVFKTLGEAVLMFGIAGVILQQSPLIILLAIVVYTLFAAVNVAINTISLRWDDVGIGLSILLAYAVPLTAMSPGIAGAILCGVLIPNIGMVIGLLLLTVWELLIAVLFFWIGKGALNNCNMPVIRAEQVQAK